jgi:hypothetical protein
MPKQAYDVLMRQKYMSSRLPSELPDFARHQMPVRLQGALQQLAKPLLVLHRQDVHGRTPCQLSL